MAAFSGASTAPLFDGLVGGVDLRLELLQEFELAYEIGGAGVVALAVQALGEPRFELALIGGYAPAQLVERRGGLGPGRVLEGLAQLPLLHPETGPDSGVG